MNRPNPDTLTPEALAYIETLESNLRTVQEILSHLPKCSSWDDEHPCSNFGCVQDSWGRWVCDECASKVRGSTGGDGPQATTARIWDRLRKDARVWMPPDPVTAQGLVIKLQSASLHAAALLALFSNGAVYKARRILEWEYKSWEDPISEELSKLQGENSRLWEVLNYLPRCICGHWATYLRKEDADSLLPAHLCDVHVGDRPYLEFQYAGALRNLNKGIEEEKRRETEALKNAQPT